MTAKDWTPQARSNGDIQLRQMVTRWRIYNARYFGGQLRQPAIRLVELPKLGDSVVSGYFAEDGAIELAGSDDGALRHEIVHQWQHHMGLGVDHDAGFYAMAEMVGAPVGIRWRLEEILQPPVASVALRPKRRLSVGERQARLRKRRAEVDRRYRARHGRR